MQIAKTKCGQAHKTAHVDSEDIESTDDNAGHTEDQADAYEQLRLECETDRPVCGEIIIGNSLTKPFRSKKKCSSHGNNSCTTDVHTIFIPTMSDNTIKKGHWCEVCM